MKIYVLETVFDDDVQLGFSTSKKVAEQKAKEWEEGYFKNCGRHIHVWITEYKEGKDKYCEFG